MMYNNFINFDWMVGFAPYFGIITVWSLFWKGLALWHSARRKEPWWFVVMLFLNTVGILEIIYLFGFAKIKLEELFQNK